MVKALKVTGVILLVLLGLGLASSLVFHTPEPEGKTGEEADRLAQQMLEAMDIAGWDTTRYLQWTFVNNNIYLWDKERNHVVVVSSKDSIILDANSVTGRVYQRNGEEILGLDADKAIASAWKNFCNDGFWLYAPFKVFDAGTVLSIVDLEDGSQALKVTYMEGGVTPGDSYLWVLDANLRPKAWRMWVSIFPIGGVEFSWDGWQQLPTGAWLSTIHGSKVFDMEIKEMRSGQTLQELGITSDPFSH